MSNDSRLPITLGIAQTGDPQVVSSLGLASDVRQKIFERDKHTCRFCGFTSQKYQDVHALNGNYTDTVMDNLVTACIYCHQCFDLGKVSAMKSGVLIWMPEMPQADLNHLARALYVAQISQGAMADIANSVKEMIMNRRTDAQSRISTDDPFILAMVMRDFLTPRHYALRDKKLDGIRLWPLDRRIIKEGELEFNQFPQILAYWRSKDGPFGGKPPHQWKNLYADLLRNQAA